MQEEIYRRAHIEINGRRHVYSSRYALSSIVFCCECGNIYRRLTWNNRGKRYVVWRCVNRVQGGKKNCPSRTVPEEDLQRAVVDAINQVWAQQQDYLAVIKENIREMLAMDHEKELSEIDRKLTEKQEELVKIARAGGDYDELADEIETLRGERNAILTKDAVGKGAIRRMEDMQAFNDEMDGSITEYDEQLVRKLVEKITVHEDRFTIEFKSGLAVMV